MSNYEVYDNTYEKRYEIELENRTAFLAYQDNGNVRAFLHTSVPEELSGRGIATALAQYALDEAQAQQRGVSPLCPFVRSFIERNPQYKALIRF